MTYEGARGVVVRYRGGHSAWRRSSARVIQKARPPIGRTPGGLALPDKGRGLGWGWAPYPPLIGTFVRRVSQQAFFGFLSTTGRVERLRLRGHDMKTEGSPRRFSVFGAVLRNAQ